VTASEPSTPKRNITARALRAIAVSAVLLHAGQTFLGDVPWAGVACFALVAGVVFGFFFDVLRSVRTAVLLLVVLTVSCTLGTLTVQRAQVNAASEEEFQQTLAFAWAHLLVKASHPIPRDVELPPAHAEQLDRMETAFGAEIADEEREKAHKGLLAAADQQAAQELAQSWAGLFAVLYRISEALRLTDLFAAWWFIGLFYLLCGNLLVGAVVRRKPSVRNLGFHSAHLGLVLVVLGATVGAYRGQRGVLPLNVGQSSASFIGQSPMTARPLGFAVRLDRFDTLYHEDLVVEVLSTNDPHSGMMGGPAPLHHAYKLEAGSSFDLTDPESGTSWTVTMAEITESPGLVRTYLAADEGPPAVLVELREPDAAEGDSFDLWLTGDDLPYIDLDNRFKVKVSPMDGRDIDAVLEAGGDGCVPGTESGWLSLSREGAPSRVPAVDVGMVVQYEDLEILIEDLVPDFRVGKTEGDPLEFPRNPALRARMRGPDGHEGEFLFFSDPRLQGFSQLPWEGYEVTFEYDYWCSPTGDRVLVLVDGDGRATALLSGPDREPQAVPLAEGASLEHAAGSVAVAEILATGRQQTVLAQAGEDDDDRHTALKLAFDGPEDTEQWLLSNTPDGAHLLHSPDGTSGFALMLADNTDRPPRDWRSFVSFVEEGEDVGQGELEVNRPAIFRGFRFFQSDADASRPDYSGLQVVHDPAWPLVQTGLWMLLLGICWCFYVQPLFDRRGKRGEA